MNEKQIVTLDLPYIIVWLFDSLSDEKIHSHNFYPKSVAPIGQH